MPEETLLQSQTEPEVQPDASGVTAAAPSKAVSFKDFISDDGVIDVNYVNKYAEYDPTADKEALKNLLESNGNDWNRLVKQSLNLNKMLGKEKIPYPGDNATKEDWAQFWVNHMGAPKDGTDYKISDEHKAMFDEASLNGLLELGKKAHIPQRLMNEILPIVGEAINSTNSESQLNAEAQKREALEALEGVFGRHGTPEFSQNISLAQKGLKILAVDAGIDDVAGLTERYGNDPFLLQVFAAKAKASGENGAPVGSSGAQMVTVTSLDDQIAKAERLYFETKSQRDLEAVMALREKKAKFS